MNPMNWPAIYPEILLLVMATGPAHSAWMAVLPIACMAVVGTWLWLRPEPTPREPGP